MKSTQNCPNCNSYRFYNGKKCTSCGFTNNDDNNDVYPGFLY